MNNMGPARFIYDYFMFTDYCPTNMYIVLVISIALIASASGQACADARDCSLYTQKCTQVTFSGRRCTVCDPDRSRIAGGGSCFCDASTHYCSSVQGQIGVCAPYSIYNKACQADSDCLTRVTNDVHDNWPNEVLYCVNQLCKPCSPALWAQYKNGDANGVYTCAGYNKELSDNVMHYATATSLPKFMFRCAANGDIVVVNSTIDWNYQYPYGDRSSWTYSTSTITGAAAPSGSTTTTGSGKGQSSTAATLLADVAWTALIIAAIVIFKF